MKKVAITTDSSCCIPQELVSKYDIYVLPLLIIYGDKSYRDGIDMSPNEVYRIMRKREELPTTSIPSAGDFLEAYRQLSKKAESILCVTVSAQLSKTFDTALLAKEMAKDEIPNTAIEVIDSRSVAGGLGFIVLEAAKAAKEGADLAQVAEAARNMMPRINLIGTASAWMGSVLSIKPIIEVPTTTGVVEAVERARTKPKAVKRLLEIMAERVGESPVHVIVHHAGVPEEGEELKARVASQFNCVELYLTEFTPAMGVHTGPGLLGIAFYAD
ncbi:MAG: DegV family protein [Dehalococcoidia bacterium]|nr:DegV family protein [Dehalococcoidia bacterium]